MPRRSLYILLALSLLLPLTASAKPEDLDAAARKASDEAVAYLLRTQQPNGTWRRSEKSTWEEDLACTALAGLTLHTAAPKNDETRKAIKATQDAVRAKTASLRSTSAIAYSVMFLAQ